MNTDPPLSRRQQQIVALLCRGYSGKEMAKILGISYSSVRNHLTVIYAKLPLENTHNRATQTVVWFARQLQKGQ